MGQAKREIDDRPFAEETFPDVCANCFNDPALASFVKAHASADSCFYCERESDNGEPIAAHLGKVLDLINLGIRTRYNCPEAELSYAGREGGFQGSLHEMRDIIQDWVEVSDNSGDLMEDIIEAFGDDIELARINHGVTGGDILRWSWKEFCNVVKHESRYVFFRDKDRHESSREPDGIPAAQMLDALASIIQRFGLTRKLPTGTTLFRCRFHNEPQLPDDPRELGQLRQPDRAKTSNRMSPAGISMFYAAFDSDTTILETYAPHEHDNRATIGKFQLDEEVTVVDLTALPSIPSIFDLERHDTKDEIEFLCGFRNHITAPVSKDGFEHVEYVPSQIVTEYIRRVGLPNSESIHGIMYSSAKHRGHNAVVLFSTAILSETGKPRSSDDTTSIKFITRSTLSPEEVSARLNSSVPMTRTS